MPRLTDEKKQSQHILVLSWRDPKHPNNGGAEQVTHEHAKAWVKHGYAVTLFSSSFPGAIEEEVLDGVKIIRRGRELVTVQIAAFFWYLAHKDEFDIVFDHFHGIPFYTPLFVAPTKIGFIHEVAKEVWKANELPKYIAWLPALLGPIIEDLTFKWLYQKSYITSSDTPFITVSNSTKDDLISLGIKKELITVIHNGLTFPKTLPMYPKEKKHTVMFLGALALDKGIKDAISVFAELQKDKKQSWQFWIVGRCVQSQIDELTEFAKSLGISQGIRFWGYVSTPHKFELLSKAHVLMNPSIHEGWGLVNLEANACGTPVVAYDVHGSRDSVIDGKTGQLVAKGNIKAMSKAIEEIVSNEKKYKMMQEECQKWSKGFTWEKATKESLTYLERILS